MPRACELTGISTLVGNRVSHSNIKTSVRLNPNLKKKKYIINELKQTITLNLSTRAIRTIDKQGGIGKAILLAKEERLSPRLRKIRRKLERARRPKTKKKAG